MENPLKTLPDSEVFSRDPEDPAYPADEVLARLAKTIARFRKARETKEAPH